MSRAPHGFCVWGLTGLLLAVTALSAASAATLAAEAPAEKPTPDLPYVINLQSSTAPIRVEDHPAAATLGGNVLFVSRAMLRGVMWYRLRLGYFPRLTETKSALAQLTKLYPDAWLTKASASDLAAAQDSPPSEPAPTSGMESKTEKDQPIDPVVALMSEARESMVAGNYRLAAHLYARVLELNGHTHRQEAQELLGLARERNGQLAHAKAEYETYLRLYPEGENAQRVRQRLMGLITASAPSPEPLRKAGSTGKAGDTAWRGFGSISMYYRWSESTYAGITDTDESAFTTYLDYSTRRRGETYDVRARFTGQYTHELESDEEDEGRLRTFYVEALHGGRGFSGSVGRQSRSTGGILGRFDGAALSKPLSSITRLNLVAGLPVEFSSEDRINEHKEFFGINLDVGTLAGAWDLNTFYIRQQVDGITDREAIGGEVRFARDGRTLFALLDYDISFSDINTALAMTGWARADGTSLNLFLDYRKAPTLATSNALISQSAASIDELLENYNEREVRDLAKDRTATSRSATLSASKPLTEKVQLMGDITLSSISSTPASGGVEAMEGTGWDGYYSLQLVASNLLGRNDTTIFSTRFSSTESADTTSFGINHRYPVNQRLRINPRLRIDFRNANTNGDETNLIASLRVNHQYRKDLALEAEAGNEWGEQEVDAGNGEHDRRFLFFGFRKTF